MGWWQVSTDGLAGSRFVISPLAETTASLLALYRGTAAHPGERRWLDVHQAAYHAYVKDHPAIPALIAAAAGHRWVPTLITAAPVSPGGSSFDDELRLIADLTPAEVAADLAEAGLTIAADDLPRHAQDHHAAGRAHRPAPWLRRPSPAHPARRGAARTPPDRAVRALSALPRRRPPRPDSAPSGLSHPMTTR